jgi:hypothetical protein
MRFLSISETHAVSGGAISMPSKEIESIDYRPDGSTVYHFTDGSQFTVPPPLNPNGGGSGGGGGGGW